MKPVIKASTQEILLCEEYVWDRPTMRIEFAVISGGSGVRYRDGALIWTFRPTVAELPERTVILYRFRPDLYPKRDEGEYVAPSRVLTPEEVQEMVQFYLDDLRQRESLRSRWKRFEWDLIDRCVTVVRHLRP